MTAASDQVTRLYDTVYDRAPDGAGLAYWSSTLDAGTPLHTLADIFMRSSEFQGTYGTPDNGAFVAQLYYNVLGRAPDAGGLAFWTGELRQNLADRASVVTSFSESAEHVVQGPSASAGYRVVLADDFGGGYDKSHWGDPFPLPWPSGPSANGAYIADPNDVTVRDGELQVTMTHHADGHWSAGGFNSFKAGLGITYGRVDFDAKVDAGQGTVAGILMWPADDTFPPEIDILETPKNTGLFTLHWAGGDEGQSVIQDASLNPSQWHHYTLDWLPGSIEISVDGQVRARWTDHIPNVKMGFGALGVVGTVYEGWMGGAPDATTPQLLAVHLDNVVMAQWGGGIG
jgi:beta-glucanase (GH16 family)